MKNSTMSLLLAASLLASPISATAEKSASVRAKTPSHKPVAATKKSSKKQAAQNVKAGKVASGEATRQANKEAGLHRESGAREENRGRVTAAKRAKPRPQQTRASKPSGAVKHSTAAVSPRKSTTVRATSQPHPSASLKTSQLTSTKSARYHAKTASMQRDVRMSTRKQATKSPARASDQAEQATKPLNSISLKPNNARMF